MQMHHVFVVEVKIPNTLTDEEKQLYAKLYEINTKKKFQDKESLIDKVKGVFH